MLRKLGTALRAPEAESSEGRAKCGWPSQSYNVGKGPEVHCRNKGAACPRNHTLAGSKQYAASHVHVRLQGEALGPEEELAVPIEYTGLMMESLYFVGRRLTTLPGGFHPHSHVAKLMEARKNMFVNEDSRVDWAVSATLLHLLASYSWQFSGTVSTLGRSTHNLSPLGPEIRGCKVLMYAGCVIVSCPMI
jgi:hypothetical protein